MTIASTSATRNGCGSIPTNVAVAGISGSTAIASSNSTNGITVHSGGATIAATAFVPPPRRFRLIRSSSACIAWADRSSNLLACRAAASRPRA